MRRELGRRGEELAARYLRNKGYRILTRNYHTRFGELDIICEKDGRIVFVEVRSKRGCAFGTPEESLTPVKLARLRKTALAYLNEASRSWPNGIRFDVIAIREATGKTEINHIEGAF